MHTLTRINCKAENTVCTQNFKDVRKVNLADASKKHYSLLVAAALKVTTVIIYWFFEIFTHVTLTLETQNVAHYIYVIHSAFQLENAPGLLVGFIIVVCWFYIIELTLASITFFLFFVAIDACECSIIGDNTLLDYELSDSVTTNLLNGNMLVHPGLVYCALALFFVGMASLYQKSIMWRKWKLNYFSSLIFITTTKYLFYRATLLCCMALVWGAWWASQELNWGGFWAWDPVEMILLFFFFFLIRLTHLHHNNDQSLNQNLLIAFFFFFFFLHANQTFNLISVHAFFDEQLGGEFLPTLAGYFVILCICSISIFHVFYWITASTILWSSRAVAITFFFLLFLIYFSWVVLTYSTGQVLSDFILSIFLFLFLFKYSYIDFYRWVLWYLLFVIPVTTTTLTQHKSYLLFFLHSIMLLVWFLILNFSILFFMDMFITLDGAPDCINWNNVMVCIGAIESQLTGAALLYETITAWVQDSDNILRVLGPDTPPEHLFYELRVFDNWGLKFFNNNVPSHAWVVIDLPTFVYLTGTFVIWMTVLLGSSRARLKIV